MQKVAHGLAQPRSTSPRPDAEAARRLDTRPDYRLAVAVFSHLVADDSGLMSADEFSKLIPTLRKRVLPGTEEETALYSLQELSEDGIMLGPYTIIDCCFFENSWQSAPLFPARCSRLVVRNLYGTCLCRTEEFTHWWSNNPSSREKLFHHALDQVKKKA